VKYGVAAVIAASAVGYLFYKMAKSDENNDKEEKNEEQKVEIIREVKKEQKIVNKPSKVDKVFKAFIDKNLEKLIELTREDALLRSEVVSGVHYDLILSFFEHETEFDGYVRVTFQLSKVNEHAVLNFEGRVFE